jgi:hypothetical protein
MRKFGFYFLLLFAVPLYSSTVQDKVLICGVCKNTEQGFANAMTSAEKVGSEFLDYRVIIYENDSKDQTKELFQDWAQKNPKVIFISENLTKKQICKELTTGRENRTECIARARNIVLDVILKPEFDDYKYIIWADLDLSLPWDVTGIVDTILHPEQEWDAVLANGYYDVFALRSPQFPIGLELLGKPYWDRINEIRSRFVIDPQGPWIPVYSAFGGMGIYKRDAIQGCRYSGVVTKDLEKAVISWLEKAKNDEEICFLKDYNSLLKTSKILDLKKPLSKKKRTHEKIGVRLHNEWGLGEVVWFSCENKFKLPTTCEHIPFHASMAVKGHDKIFINPRLIAGFVPEK